MRLFICNSGRSFLCVYVWIMTAPSFIFCSFSSGFMNLKLYLFEVCFPCDLSQRFVFVFLLLSPYKYVFEIRGVRLFQTTVMNLTRNEFFEFLVSSFLVWLCSNSQPKTSNLCAIFSFFFFFIVTNLTLICVSSIGHLAGVTISWLQKAPWSSGQGWTRNGKVAGSSPVLAVTFCPTHTLSYIAPSYISRAMSMSFKLWNECSLCR